MIARVPPALHRAARLAAVLEECSMSALAEKALLEWLGKHHPELARAYLAGDPITTMKPRPPHG